MAKIYKKAPPKDARSSKLKAVFSVFLIICGTLLFLASLGPVIYTEFWYSVKQNKDQKMLLNLPGVLESSASGAVRDSVFARFLTGRDILIDPVNTGFSIVIEKIGVNAPIVENVSISYSSAYKAALREGIAHAINSSKPSEKAGNVYLFAHASMNFWELGGYATTFNLLRKMSTGDPIYVFYQGRAYLYEVINLEKYEDWNTYPITRPVIEPLLTLQTCDPPGTTLNRLVLTAKLKRVFSSD